MKSVLKFDSRFSTAHCQLLLSHFNFAPLPLSLHLQSGWRATLYRMDGKIDLDVDLNLWEDGDRISILKVIKPSDLKINKTKNKCVNISNQMNNKA